MKNSSEKFNQLFDSLSTIKVSSHARVNLIGEHTDYTGGYVLPSLLPFKTTIFLNENDNTNYSVFSELFNENFEFNDFIKSKSNNWLDYIKGCLFIFFDENKEIDKTYIKMFIKSDIPMGRGISSSAALCVATIKALNIFFKTGFNEKHIAILAQKVEKNYIGVSSGIMDQMVTSLGIHGKAFFLDCLSLKYELIDVPSSWSFCLIDSEVQRNLRDSSYNERFNELKNAEEILKTQHLGTIKVNQLDENSFVNKVIYRRAKHVVFENQRVLDAKKNLQEGNIKKFGILMNKSHESYSQDFEASTNDVDIIVDHSLKSGASGSRLTGGGFGGFTVSLIEKNKYDNWYKKMLNYYNKSKFYKI
jgi:galactokinase